MKVVKNSHQRKLQELQKSGHRPDPNLRTELPCRILKVFDPEYMQLELLPDQLLKRVKAAPGALWAMVSIYDRTIFVRFEESADQIYSTYGNSKALEGTKGKIKSNNYNVEAGRLTPINNVQQGLVDTGKTSKTADIGAIIGI